MKLVDVGDSKSPAARRAGSSPAPGTRIHEKSTEYISAFFILQFNIKLLRVASPILADSIRNRCTQRKQNSKIGITTFLAVEMYMPTQG